MNRPEEILIQIQHHIATMASGTRERLAAKIANELEQVYADSVFRKPVSYKAIVDALYKALEEPKS